MPKKAWRLALKSALADKVQNGKLIVLEDLQFPEPKTKAALGVLTNLKVVDGKTLIVLAEKNEIISKSTRNLPGVMTLTAEGLNVYDILFHDHLVITKDAVGKVEEALA